MVKNIKTQDARHKTPDLGKGKRSWVLGLGSWVFFCSALPRLVDFPLRKLRVSVILIMFGGALTLPGLDSTWAVPEGNPPAENAVIRQVSIDKEGVIAYIKGDGIYIYGRTRGARRLVQVGDEAPRTGGQFAEFLDLASATVSAGVGDDLRIAFRARISPLSEGNPKSEIRNPKSVRSGSDFDIRASNFPEGGREGIFLFSENQGVSAVALPGDIAPNTGGGALSQFSGQLLINPRGTIAFKAAVVGGRAREGIFFAFRDFLSGEERVDSLAIQGEPAPDTGGGAYASFVDCALTQRQLAIPIFPFVITVDVFAFIAQVEGGRVSQGLYLSSFIFLPGPPPLFSLRPQLLAFPGAKAPGVGSGVTYTEFKSVVLTNPSDPLTINEVVFRATVTNSKQEVLEGIFQIAFIGPIPFDSPRVLQGQQAPVSGGRYRFVSFERMAANNSEQLSFVATLDGGGPSEGLFQVTLGPLQVVSTTLVTGDRAPGDDGSVYADLGPISINSDGWIVFQSALRGGNKMEAVFRVLAKRARMIDSVP